MDPAAREKLLQESLAIALADLLSIPLHFESSIWAYRKGLTYEGRADQYTPGHVGQARQVAPPGARNSRAHQGNIKWPYSSCAG